jgi:hypothetical protein
MDKRRRGALSFSEDCTYGWWDSDQMQIDLEIKNYRCFPDSEPVHISLRPGFTAFVGVNNAGKSSLLKFFHEFRPLFAILSSPSGEFGGAISSGNASLPFAAGDFFCDFNDRNLEVKIAFTATASERSGAPPVAVAEGVRIVIDRATNWWSAELDVLPRTAANSAMFTGADTVRTYAVEREPVVAPATTCGHSTATTQDIGGKPATA